MKRFKSQNFLFFTFAINKEKSPIFLWNKFQNEWKLTILPDLNPEQTMDYKSDAIFDYGIQWQGIFLLLWQILICTQIIDK